MSPLNKRAGSAPSTRSIRSSSRIDGSGPAARLATVPNTAQVALEAGNSPQMIFGHYRELVRGMDAEKWFSITPEAVDLAKAARQATGGEARESGGPIVVKKLLKGASSFDQAFWWWRDKDGVTRMGAADSVLGTAELTGLLRSE